MRTWIWQAVGHRAGYLNPDMWVVSPNGQTHGAVRVEEVIGMIEVERAECRPLPAHFQKEERT